ncbi:MAG: DUF1343 domain-containing protein [Thermoanaerobaculia bacterium]|nr:DUF1343 domain-containing protein [Thermoanaerobaculia bacterium]
MIRCGLDRLLAEPGALRGRRCGLLAHGAALDVELRPAHLALAAAGAPAARLFGPEHGYYGVEQDMVPSTDAVDPWTGTPIVSLYGETERSLRPRPEAFDGLDLLLVDLQDVGARYYTFAATAVWAAAAALGAGLEVWILDRPNPLGGAIVEGPFVAPGFESFVGAFRMPVRHGLTLGEIVRLELRRAGVAADGLRVLEVDGWRRDRLWPQLGRPWIATSPNMPDFDTALLYPGLCLLEATELSEGRGTTRPFRLVGAPGVDPRALADELEALREWGVAAIPTYFRPWHQKHRGEVCGGVELAVVDAARVAGLRVGVELLSALSRVAADAFRWRRAPYEFVSDRPAIDLLAGGEPLRRALESGRGLAEWIASWETDERAFRAERRAALLYPEAA